MYTSWVIRFLPIVVILVVSNILFMLIGTKKNDSLGGSKDYFKEEYKKLPKISLEEVLALSLFLLATILSFTRQFYQDLLPGLKPAYVFIICAIISFFLTEKSGSRLMVWKNVQKNITWDLIFVFAGGLAAGTLINGSGAAAAIGDLVSKAGLTGNIVTVLIIISVTIILSDVTSNTATAAVALPIVIAIAQGIGKNPVPYIYIASIGVNLSYTLPTSIRAIPVGYGLSPKYMFRYGWKLTLIVIALMTGIGWLFLEYWPMFSTT